MKAILDALEALCCAVPGVKSLGVAFTERGRPMFTISVDSDELVRDLAAKLGCEEPKLGGNACVEWLTAYGNDTYIAIHGPHRARGTIEPIDPTKVDAAIAQAAAAIGEVSS